MTRKIFTSYLPLSNAALRANEDAWVKVLAKEEIQLGDDEGLWSRAANMVRMRPEKALFTTAAKEEERHHLLHKLIKALLEGGLCQG